MSRVPNDNRGGRGARGGGRRRGPGGGRKRPPGAHQVPGERAVTELLRGAPERVVRIVFETGREFPELRALANAEGLPVEEVDGRVLEDWVGPGNARGVVAIASSPVTEDIDAFLDQVGPEEGPRRRIVVALDGVVDPHNLGAIIRSAEFLGARGVFWAKDRSAPLSAVAVRSSAGATERLPLLSVTNLARALETLQAAGFWTLGTVVDEAPSLHGQRLELPESLVVVMGSEHKGIRRLTRERCDYLARIDGGGTLGSLNVSSAAAVVFALLLAPRNGVDDTETKR